MPAETGQGLTETVSALTAAIVAAYTIIRGGHWGHGKWTSRNNGNGDGHASSNGHSKVSTHQAVEALENKLVPLMKDISENMKGIQENGKEEISLLKEISKDMAYQRGVMEGKKEYRDDLYRRRQDEERKRERG